MEPENMTVMENGKMMHENGEIFIKSAKSVNDNEEIKIAAQNTRIVTADTLSEEETRKLLSEYIVRTGKTQAQIAKEMNISVAQISQFISSTYKTPQKFIEKFTVYLKLERKKDISPKKPGFRRTSISGSILDLITYCHIQGVLGIVYGDAGVGKTMAIKEYQRQNPDTAIVITSSPTYATISGVSELLADKMHIQKRGSRGIYKAAVERLIDSNKIIIVDEAQHLTIEAINHLRCIGDESEAAMVLVGNDEIYIKINGEDKPSHSQYRNRIAAHKHVTTKQITMEDIQMVFDNESIDSKAYELLLKICQTSAAFRGTVYAYINAAAVFHEITAKGIALIAKDMNIR